MLYTKKNIWIWQNKIVAKAPKYYNRVVRELIEGQWQCPDYKMLSLLNCWRKPSTSLLLWWTMVLIILKFNYFPVQWHIHTHTTWETEISGTCSLPKYQCSSWCGLNSNFHAIFYLWWCLTTCTQYDKFTPDM